jgi:hypothetical protein
MTERRDIKTRLIQPCWGLFDIDGNWHPNPFLVMSAEEQRRQNVAAGYMTEDGKRIKLPLYR